MKGALAKVRMLALSGDLQAAVSELSRVNTNTLTPAERRERQRYIDRFVERKQTVTSNLLVDRAVSTYESYWTRVLFAETDPVTAEAQLCWHIVHLLRQFNRPIANLSSEAVLYELSDALLERGLYSSAGETEILKDLLIWKTQKDIAYKVALPTENRTVVVRVVDDFLCLGWAAFATCDVSYPKAWWSKDVLYCVAKAYDTRTEEFKVELLTHEAQHASDRVAFPKLGAAEIEYRAKLVELINVSDPHRTIVRFSAETTPTRIDPEGFANHCLVRDFVLAAGWPHAPNDDLQEAALEMLQISTARLASLGAETVTEDPWMVG